MNKRIFISFLLLTIAVVLSMFSFFLLQARFSALGEALKSALYADLPLLESCRQIESAWDKCAAAAQLFLLHSDLNELRTAVESLRDLLDEPVVYRNACIRSLHLLEGIIDSLYAVPENIL